MDGSKTYVFIPFRSGSKGIPHKNIRRMRGKPLYAHSLDVATALSSKLVDKIIIGTDYQQALFWNYIKRDTRVSYWDRTGTLGVEDHASTERVLGELLSMYPEIKPRDTIVLLQVTNPFITPDVLTKAVESYEGTGTLFSVVPFDRYIYTENKKLLHYKTRQRRQEMEHLFLENGAFYIFNVGEFIVSGNRMNSPLNFFQMEKSSTFEIDDIDDWSLIERLMS